MDVLNIYRQKYRELAFKHLQERMTFELEMDNNTLERNYSFFKLINDVRNIDVFSYKEYNLVYEEINASLNNHSILKKYLYNEINLLICNYNNFERVEYEEK